MPDGTMPAPRGAVRFYANLEPIRGIAALSVVLVHCIGAYPIAAQATGLGAIALAWFQDALNGRNAVVLFFVLSGFVLCESVRNEEPSFRLFGSFMIKRCFRILPVAWSGLVLGALYLSLATPGAEVLSHGASWFTAGFGRTNGPDLLVNFLFLSNHIDTVYWTLYVELMGSLLFVPLLYVARSWGWLTQSILQAGLLVVSYRCFGHGIGTVAWPHLLRLPLMPSFLNVLPNFLMYFFCFHLGILVNQLRTRTNERMVRETTNPRRAAIVEAALTVMGVGLLCYAHSWIAADLSGFATMALGSDYDHDAIAAAIEAFGACLIVYGCTGGHNTVINAVLGGGVIRYLGRLSFGIYAVHLLILKPVFVQVVTWYGLDFPRFPLLGPLLSIVIVVPSAIALAHVLHVFVERPGVRFARVITSLAWPRGGEKSPAVAVD